jgi:hypothetical protein
MNPNVVILYNDGLNAYLLGAEFLQQYRSRVSVIVQLPAVPINPKTGKRMARTMERLRRAAWTYLIFNAVMLPGYALLARFGRGSLRRIAKDMGVEHAVLPAADDRFISLLRERRPDWILNFSSLIIKREHLIMTGRGVLNFHGAPLPRYRGAGNFFWMLADGIDCAHATFHFVDEGLDTGPIIAFSAPLRVTSDLSVFQLWLQMRLRCYPILDRFFSEFSDRPAIFGAPQDQLAAVTRSFPTSDVVRRVRQRGHRVFRLRDVVEVLRIAFTGQLKRSVGASKDIKFCHAEHPQTSRTELGWHGTSN